MARSTARPTARTSDLAQVRRNRRFVVHARSLRPGTPTIGSPRIPATWNPSGQTGFSTAGYADVFDGLVTFEATATDDRASESRRTTWPLNPPGASRI
ncbi:MAG: hypothetical protein R3F35_08380 [Myxococcota bacterium]